MSICEAGTSPEVNIPMRQPGRIDQLRRHAAAARAGLDGLFENLEDKEAAVVGRDAYVRVNGCLEVASVVVNESTTRQTISVNAYGHLDDLLLRWLLVNAIFRDEYGRWRWTVGQDGSGYLTFNELEDAQNHIAEHFGLTK